MDYLVLLLANGTMISLPGLLVYLFGLMLLTLNLLGRKKYWWALGLGVVYTWIWVFAGIWWIAN